MEYVNKCPNCGEYKVDETSFKTQLTPYLRRQLKSKEKADAAVFTFTKSCPRCELQSLRQKGTLSVRTEI